MKKMALLGQCILLIAIHSVIYQKFSELTNNFMFFFSIYMIFNDEVTLNNNLKNKDFLPLCSIWNIGY